ncbi:lysozyme inhibitor LprI family protein [Phenylobacterium sp. J367]|uniref:lysozyme inhibitor LprI family protein n=1 Tax=Phenylobacterium sp. J367 TaxID=2898435 RepID=UPI002151E904|nr:lysozyme inhibitor LprI family protein [Phenylobacterium sp. J367]MCR5878242.1 lysozyme inhibitor LprI family protein [Phenylobacterium sp. J367]
MVARVAEPPPIPARARPSFDCRNAGTRAERMICGDDELARLDRRLDRAFDRAVSSGIPYRELRAEQDDWLQIREDAARRSSGAVASVYSQRIRELNDLAEGY